MGTLEKKWGPNGDTKSEKGPHGDPGPQMGTYVGTVPMIKMFFPLRSQQKSGTLEEIRPPHIICLQCLE